MRKLYSFFSGLSDQWYGYKLFQNNYIDVCEDILIHSSQQLYSLKVSNH